MHEATIAQNIIDSVVRLKEQGAVAGKVTSVALKIGKLTAVVPDNLRFMFNVLTQEGPLEGVRLEIQEMPLRGACSACGFEYEMDDMQFVCPSCGQAEVRLAGGRELLIEAVEVE